MKTYILQFGKHKGERLRDILCDEPQYLLWLKVFYSGNDQELKEILKSLKFNNIGEYNTKFQSWNIIKLTYSADFDFSKDFNVRQCDMVQFDLVID
jgi:hypothetical protein